MNASAIPATRKPSERFPPATYFLTILDASAAWLRANAGTLVLIEGHCDERGTDAYNLALGDRRAKAAMDYLVSRGIQADRITTLSYGKERPVCREHTEACWAKNRRAAFSVKAR